MPTHLHRAPRTGASLYERRRLMMRREIAEAAVDLFEQQGYANTTVEQIASAVGVSMRTFYRHCASKDEALAFDLADGPAELVSRVRGYADRSLTEAVVTAFVEVSDGGARRRKLRLIGSTPALRSAWLSAGREAQDDLFQAIREQTPELPEFHARVQAAAIIGVLTCVIETWAQDDSSDLETLTRTALQLIGH